jgi:hypothetical protein
MKNLTGGALQWRGVVYNPGDDVPEAIAQEMQLAAMPDQIKGVQKQGGSEPPQPVTDPYSLQAMSAAQYVSPPMVLAASEIGVSEQSNPDVSFGGIVDFDALSVPVNLKPLEKEAEVSAAEGGATEEGKSEAEATQKLIEQQEIQASEAIAAAKKLEEEAAISQQDALSRLGSAINTSTEGETEGEATPETPTAKRKRQS